MAGWNGDCHLDAEMQSAFVYDCTTCYDDQQYKFANFKRTVIKLKGIGHRNDGAQRDGNVKLHTKSTLR